MRRLLTTLVALVWVAACNVHIDTGSGAGTKLDAGTTEQRTEALRAANEFFKELDSGAIDASWATTSPLLRAQTSQTAWNSTIGAIRAGLGKLQARELQGVGFTQTVPDAPAGDYAFVVYNSTFSLATVEEKAVLQKVNASWKVAGYFVSKSVKASASVKNHDS